MCQVVFIKTTYAEKNNSLGSTCQNNILIRKVYPVSSVRQGRLENESSTFVLIPAFEIYTSWQDSSSPMLWYFKSMCGRRSLTEDAVLMLHWKEHASKRVCRNGKFSNKYCFSCNKNTTNHVYYCQGIFWGSNPSSRSVWSVENSSSRVRLHAWFGL